MSFQKKELFGHFFRAVFACVLFLVVAAATIFLVQNEGELLYVLLFAALLIGEAYFAYKSVALLIRKASECRHAKESRR